MFGLAVHVNEQFHQGELLVPYIPLANPQAEFCERPRRRRAPLKREPDQSNRDIQTPTAAVPTYSVSRAVEGGQRQPSLYDHSLKLQTPEASTL